MPGLTSGAHRSRLAQAGASLVLGSGLPAPTRPPGGRSPKQRSPRQRGGFLNPSRAADAELSTLAALPALQRDDSGGPSGPGTPTQRGMFRVGVAAQVRREMDGELAAAERRADERAAQEAASLAALRPQQPREASGSSSPRAQHAQRQHAAVRIQAAARRALAMRRLFEQRRAAAARGGVMAALPGWRQGRTGWYSDGQRMAFVVCEHQRGGAFRVVIGPLDAPTYQRLRREALRPRGRGRVMLACPGTTQGAAGLYVDNAMMVSRWDVNFAGQWLLRPL